jgi:flagellar hook-associated protein 1 FlgK
MSISQALNTSLAGLRATQSGLSLIAANVANAQTPGYVRKSLDLSASTAGGAGASVRVVGVNRELDRYLQSQLRVETSGGAYADMRAQFYSRLQQLYGDPNSDSALESVFNDFTSAVQSLVTSPDSTAARSLVLSSAQVLAQTLNSTTADIQSLREDAENGLADAVSDANDAIKKITDLNTQLAGRDISNASDAALADQRDYYVDQLSQLMDIRVVEGDEGQINVFTNSGVQLVGSQATQLSFSPQGSISPGTQWNADPAQSTLSSLKLVLPDGTSVDLTANKSIRSGKIAAYLDMRDNVLVQAQQQLDALASTMAQAMSNQTVNGSVATSGLQAGFSVDTSGMLAGNVIHLTYTDNAGPTTHNVSIVRVDDPSVLPLDNTATADANDEVIGIDFSGGMASVVTQLNAAFPGLTFSNTGSVLTALDDGAPNTTDVGALSVTQTASGLANGSVSVGLFTDGTAAFSGAIGAAGAQSIGFAGRIAVNPGLLADPAKLTLFSSGTASGDPTRPNFLYQQLTNTSFAFSAETGLGNTGSPFNGSVPDFLRQVLSMQGGAAANAQSLAEGQDVVVNALKQRVSDASGVNIDQEMANLITLQTAYGANARVMTAVRDMIDTLMKM